MKKYVVILAVVLGTANMYAQDYDLQGIGKALSTIFSEVSDFEWRNTFGDYFLDDYHEGLCLVKTQFVGQFKYGFIDKYGKLAIPFRDYDDCYHFSEGLACVTKDEKSGFIDKKGNIVIPLIYDENTSYRLNFFHDGIAIVKKDGKYGVIDKLGRTVIPFGFGVDPNYSEGLIGCGRNINGKIQYGYIDLNGKEVIPFIYGSVGDFSDGVAHVYIPGYYDNTNHYHTRIGVHIDKNGNTLSLPKGYGSQDGLFKDGLYNCVFDNAEKSQTNGYCDKTGNAVITHSYDSPHDFSEGLAAVSKDSKWGFIDKTGKLVVPCIYDEAGDFSDGLAKVAFEFDGAEGSRVWGYIDKTGKVVIPFDITEDLAIAWAPGDFYEGFAKCGKGFIDKNGNTSSNIRIEKIACYVCEPQRKLEKANIIKTNKLTPESSWDRKVFWIDKISELDEIPLNSTEARLMTTHPSNSYELIKDEDAYLIIKIKDPQSFWSSSKYLVVIQSGDIRCLM